jgi:hypothetical protein
MVLLQVQMMYQTVWMVMRAIQLVLVKGQVLMNQLRAHHVHHHLWWTSQQ